MLLRSRVGLAVYRLLPNHWSWPLLTAAERARVIAADIAHNTLRPDYADPALYQGGQNFDTVTDRRATPRGKLIGQFLDRVRPAHVLEVGPGAGFYTNLIVTHPAVREYTAVDLNPAFLEYLRPRIESMGLPSHFIHGTLADVSTSVDAALLISTVHHVPDRVALFRQIRQSLAPGGAVLAVDPSHYLLQLRKVWRKAWTPGYLAEAIRTGSVSTHNMCTLGEYRAVARANDLAIRATEFFNHPRKVQAIAARGVPLGPLWRWTSQEMAVELTRRP